jgi:hypothetical protein
MILRGHDLISWYSERSFAEKVELRTFWATPASTPLPACLTGEYRENKEKRKSEKFWEKFYEEQELEKSKRAEETESQEQGAVEGK